MFLFFIIFDKIYISKGVVGIKTIELKNLNIKINSGELVSIIGPNGSGKTVLLKLISGRIKNNYLLIDGKDMSYYDIDYKINNIVCVFDDNIYNTNNTRDELLYYLNKININNIDKNNRLDNFIEYFNLYDLIDNSFSNMSIQDRIYVKILSLLIIIPGLFCIDDLLTYLNKDKKIKILNYIKEKNITLINVTSNMEDLKLLDKILIISKGKKVLFDRTEDVLVNEDIFRDLGINLPFIYDINNMLKSYDLINENHIIEKELVDLLWK